MTDGREDPRGLALGAAAFGLWGLFPLYWPLLEPAAASEILAHRILWSLIVTAGLLLVTRRTAALRAIWRDRRARLALTGAGVVIGFNWFTYIWGVNNGHVVETSLGYYINPLVTVLMGVVILGERLRRWQWARAVDRVRGGRGPDAGARPTAVDLARPGVQLRHLRAAEEARARRAGGGPDV